MDSPIPHADIRAIEDRSWTLRLCDVIRDLDVPLSERLEACETLGAIDDARAIIPLQEVVVDTTLPMELRLEAGEALFEIEPPASDDQRSVWWASGDPVHMSRALWSMERGDAELVLSVATDPEHPLRATALGALAFGFDQPRFHAALIEALEHGAPAAREAAADVLLWDQPVAAQDALIVAADDDDEDVADNAIAALAWYESRRTLRELTDLATTGHTADIRDAAEEAAAHLQSMFAGAAERFAERTGELELFRAWADPIADLVEWPAGPRDATPAPSPEREQVVPPIAVVRELLADPDLPRREVFEALRPVRWDGYDDGARAELRALLLGNPDASLRCIAGRPLQHWGDRDALHQLARDPHRAVRKDAYARLAKMPADPGSAELLWEAALRERGLAASEALYAYVVHASRDEALPRLVDLARHDARDTVRDAAVLALTDLAARDEITELLPLLGAGPYVTWSQHCHLLDAVHKLELPTPPIEHLVDVDDLPLQESLIPLRAREAARS